MTFLIDGISTPIPMATVAIPSGSDPTLQLSEGHGIVRTAYFQARIQPPRDSTVPFLGICQKIWMQIHTISGEDTVLSMDNSIYSIYLP